MTNGAMNVHPERKRDAADGDGQRAIESAGGGADSTEVLVAQGVSKSFGPTRALQGADLALQRGTVHVLLGENGAGKSTLAKIICGIHRQDSGSITIEGRTCQFGNVGEAQRARVGMVFQELSLAPQLTCAANVFLGFEHRASPWSLLGRRREVERCSEVFGELELDVSPTRIVAELPIAQKQLVEIAKALVREPQVLVMDEPTSTLTDHDKSALFRVIRSLKEKGVAILYVTHHLREVAEIGDYVSTMVNGRVTATLPVTPEVTESRLIELLTGRDITQHGRRSRPAASEFVLEIDRLSTRGKCREINMKIGRGEVVGIYGVVGCGREGLSRVLLGLERPESGTVRLHGREYRPRHPAHAKASGVGYLPMDRKEQGLLPTRSIRENVNLTRLRRFAALIGVISGARERGRTAEYLEKLFVRYGSPSDPITSLSGGNQQKVLFGRSIGDAPKLAVMEDPTAGVDVGAKNDLYGLVRAAADGGTAFLVLSSDLPETINLCDRILLMYNGRIVDEIEDPSFQDEERILEGVLGKRYESTAGEVI